MGISLYGTRFLNRNSSNFVKSYSYLFIYLNFLRRSNIRSGHVVTHVCPLQSATRCGQRVLSTLVVAVAQRLNMYIYYNLL